jgi:hypothetical protein
LIAADAERVEQAFQARLAIIVSEAAGGTLDTTHLIVGRLQRFISAPALVIMHVDDMLD